jgi:hypothetical protein
VDLPAFYREMARVLNPHGALAIWGYPLLRFGIPEADKVLHDFTEGLLEPYWDDKRRKVEDQYEGGGDLLAFTSG